MILIPYNQLQRKSSLSLDILPEIHQKNIDHLSFLLVLASAQQKGMTPQL